MIYNVCREVTRNLPKEKLCVHNHIFLEWYNLSPIQHTIDPRMWTY